MNTSIVVSNVTPRSLSKTVGTIGWLLLCSGIVTGAWAVPQSVSHTRQVLLDPPVAGLDEHLTDVQRDTATWLADQLGGRWGRYGWYLGPGEKGTLRINLPGTSAGRLKLRLWIFNPGQLSVTLHDSTHSYRLDIDRLDGLRTLVVDGTSEIVIESTNQLPFEQLVFDRFMAAWMPSERDMPSLWPMACVLLLGLLGSGLIVFSRSSAEAWKPWLGYTGILLTTSIGFVHRWDVFDIARALPPDPDVIAYMAYAHQLDWFSPDHGFFSGNFNEREPLHVAGLNLWFRLWGDTAPSVQWYTMCQSALLIPAAGAFVWALTRKWWLGVVASWAMALNPAWIDEAVRGLRLESLSLLFLAAVCAWLWARGWTGAVLLGLITGLTALIQSPALGVMLPFFWSAWLVNQWRGRSGGELVSPSHWKWQHLGTASIVALSVFMPHLHGLYKVHGDPFWPSYGYARWNANMEFPERIGTEGFPTLEEFKRTPYTGPRITYREYLFGMHSISALIRGQLKGWIESTAFMSASPTPRLKELIFLYHASGTRALMRHIGFWTITVLALSLGLTAIGWLALLTHRTYWWIPLLSVWGTWYVAFLYSVRLVEPFRHTGHVYVLLLCCLIWGGYCLLSDFIQTFRSSRSPSG
jgi:hypothetical protein